jgi:predicted GNAT family acetyltransferase
MDLPDITYTSDLAGIDWQELTTSLTADDFDNGRTPQQLRISFENSYAVCFAWADGRVIGKARALSDGVCNAYVVDVWTHSDFRRQGIASEMMRRLMQRLEGQHIYLQADEDVLGFYANLGFKEQPSGLSRVVGQWLVNETRTLK